MTAKIQEKTFLESLKSSGLAKGPSLLLAILLPFTLMPEMAYALPHGGVVTKGAATLSYSTNRLLVNQNTSSASFSWSSYNVGSSQTVQYRTPGSSSVSMNFIGGTTPAQISGQVISNGQLVFMDPNGIVFGTGSSVSAAGVRAFGANTNTGTITPTGSVSNAGTLTAGTGGQIVLVGTSVTNTGAILAPSGQVVLAAGSTATLSESPSSSLSVVTTGGGSIYDSGTITAENADGTPGAIAMKAGMTSGSVSLEPSAVLDASAPTGGNGGTVTIDASEVVLDNVAPIDVSAPYGLKGSVVVDPNLIISGSSGGNGGAGGSGGTAGTTGSTGSSGGNGGAGGSGSTAGTTGSTGSSGGAGGSGSTAGTTGPTGNSGGAGGSGGTAGTTGPTGSSGGNGGSGTASYVNGAGSGDYTITEAPGNSTALSIMVPPLTSGFGAVFFDNGHGAVPPPVDALVGSGVSLVSGTGGLGPSQNPDILSETGNILDAEDAP